MDRDQDKTVISESQDKDKAPATQKIGHYEVVAELGRGGMGTVYRGYESSLNRYVAIKVLAPHLADDESLVGRFSREAKSVAALNHPNVVHIYFTGEQDNLPYFVMECIEGETLADRVREKGTLGSKEAAGILMQAAKGLACAHDRGIIHRDVKPSNLMIEPSGTVKITDFGIALARDIGDKLTTTGQFVGTTGYVSPEVFQGRAVDSRSDIFSLGVVLFEMLAGVKPFDDESPMGLMLQVVEKPAPDIQTLNPDVDARLQSILKRMIEKDPDNRYQTCQDLVEDLSHYLANEPLMGEPLASAQARPARQSRRVLPVLLLVCLGLGAAAYSFRVPLSELVSGTDSAQEPDLEMASSSPAADELVAEDMVSSPDIATRENHARLTSNNPDIDNDVSNKTDLAGADASAADAVSEGTAPQLAQASIMHDAQPTKRASEIHRAPGTAAVKSAALPAPKAAVIASRGDPSIVGPLATQLDEALRSDAVEVLDPAFVPGAQQALQAQQPDLSYLKDHLIGAGGRYLILLTATALDAEAIEFYGQYDTLYSAQIDVVLYDLTQTRSLGRWSEQVSYTNLNAADKARDAFAGHLLSLAEQIAQ
ncbi:serine/threonine-protein kinase [Gilvimarinus sp. SDUM040013]|uniref:Serine/threonine-protein kinase n=1 Tax=Gilvimarinus gilvus TaxID=3058038 RepID=A0ABU4S0W2_9GAMM|nr:serine/threonine-protein kinase [Gilvimarinus sp. SDUM040013]MDO3384726.1 serine/threonine-protein kinase [Gilvimarinus sp. SDUM040013]MDX6850799.1 serine/threonine-protein kinase [Gilvimarinus sp. SDUM040013]